MAEGWKEFTCNQKTLSKKYLKKCLIFLHKGLFHRVLGTRIKYLFK